MAKSATIKLTMAGSSDTLFSLYSDADLFANPFDSGISKADMISGYTTNTVPDTATIIRIKKEGCDDFLDLGLPCDSPFDIFFKDVLNSKQTDPTKSWAEIIDLILDKGIVSNSCNICCPDCGVNTDYTFSSVETYLKYAEAVGLTQSAAVPA
jgi:hypothetical protein